MRSLYSALFSALEQCEFREEKRPIRAFPVAYPLIESTWRLRERRITPIGLVPRHLLQALTILGPSTVTTLNNIYCFGEQEITDTFNEMVRDGAPVAVHYGRWSLRSMEQNENADHFVCEETHERKFLHDGLTGELLPIDFLEKSRSIRLFPLEIEPEKMTDRKKQPVHVHLRLSPSFADGSVSLKTIVESTDYERRVLLGVPNGAFALAETTPLSQKRAWLLVFALLHQNGEMQIVHEVDSAITLPEGNFPNLKSYLKSFPKIRSKFDQNTSGENTSKDKSSLGITERSSGKMVVSLDGLDPPLTLRDFGNNELKDQSRQRLARILARGENWDAKTGALTKLVPGDKNTARIALLFRSVISLRKKLFQPPERNDHLSDRSKIDDFLIKRQGEILDSLPNSAQCEPITLEELLREIRIYPDQEFVEKLSMIAGRRDEDVNSKPVARHGVGLLCNFPGNPSYERQLGNSILEAIRRSKKRIDLISPAVELFGELRQEIDAAIRRGVAIRLITQVTDPGSFYPPLPTRGIPGEKHSPDHVRNMTLLGVLCRQPRFFCHPKMVLTDTELLLSSANLNPNSLGFGLANSIEAGIWLEDRSLLHFAEQMFEGIWSASPIRQHLQGENVNITENPVEEIPPNVLEQEFDNWKFLLSVPPDHYNLTEELVRSIDGAEQSVRISTLSIYETEKIPQLHKSLLSACKRNVKVTIFTRRNAFKANQWPDPSTKELLRHGVRIRLVDGLHAKLMEIDGNKFGCFSGNLTPYSLSSAEPTAHMEIGLFGSLPSIQEAIVRLLDQCMEVSAGDTV